MAAVRSAKYVDDALTANLDGDSDNLVLLGQGINPEDGKPFKPQFDAVAESNGWTRRQATRELEREWWRELEASWPLIRRVAKMLLDGCTDVEVITKAVHG